ncbi:MAG: polysaccharide biosynthesis/export family protein [Gemmatimonadetes bacterium]|nr:polysaccharide biosynthesis/export family protein [Gemmatimonadota bacterium]
MRLTRMCRPFLTCVAVIAVAGCATRQPALRKPVALVSARPVWRIDIGDVIRTRVYREPELTGEAQVTESGSAFFAGLGKVNVSGLTLDSLQADVQARYAKLVVDPAVDVQFSRELMVYGQVRNPGPVVVDQATTVLGVLAKSGGSVGSGREPLIYLVKRDGRNFVLPREARLSSVDISRGDAIYVQDEDFFIRNQGIMGSLFQVAQVATMIFGAISLLTR